MTRWLGATFLRIAAMTYIFAATSRVMPTPRNALVVVTDSAAGVWSPIVALAISIARVIIVVAVVVVVVMHMNAGTAVPVVMPVIMAMVRVTVVAMVIDMQAVGEPADGECCRYAPKESMRK